MRVDMVVDSLGLGGIQTLLADARPEFRQARVRLVALQEPDGPAFLASEPSDVTLSSHGALERARELRRLWRRDRPDVVHSMNYRAGVVARLAAGRGIPVVHHDHGDAWDMGTHQAAVDRALAPRTARLVTVSGAAARMWSRREHLPRSRIHVVPNGVPIQGEGAGPAGDADLVVGLGRLVPSKGFESLLEAFAILRRGGTDLDLRIYGEGPSRPFLERLAERLGLDAREILPGPHPDVAEALRRAACFVHASVYESFGMVLLEAAAHGVPVVSTRSCATPEILSDAEALFLDPTGPVLERPRGFLRPPRRVPVGADGPWIRARRLDPVLLARAIQTVEDQPAQARGRAAAARRRVAGEFSVSRFVDRLEDLYASLA